MYCTLKIARVEVPIELLFAVLQARPQFTLQLCEIFRFARSFWGSSTVLIRVLAIPGNAVRLGYHRKSKIVKQSSRTLHFCKVLVVGRS